MNLESIKTALQGKKTYFTVAIGLLYLLGVWLGFWEFNEVVASALGLGALGFLRLGMKKSGVPVLLLSMVGASALLVGCASSSQPGMFNANIRALRGAVRWRFSRRTAGARISSTSWSTTSSTRGTRGGSVSTG